MTHSRALYAAAALLVIGASALLAGQALGGQSQAERARRWGVPLQQANDIEAIRSYYKTQFSAFASVDVQKISFASRDLCTVLADTGSGVRITHAMVYQKVRSGWRLLLKLDPTGVNSPYSFRRDGSSLMIRQEAQDSGGKVSQKTVLTLLPDSLSQ